MSKTIVKIIIAILFFGIIGWDIWLYVDDIPGNTITQIFIEGSEATPYVPLCIGLLMGWLIGHFYG